MLNKQNPSPKIDQIKASDDASHEEHVQRGCLVRALADLNTGHLNKRKFKLSKLHFM